MIERIKLKSQSLGILESWNLEILDSETEDELSSVFCKMRSFSCTKTCDKMDCKNTIQCFYSILDKIFVL